MPMLILYRWCPPIDYADVIPRLRGIFATLSALGKLTDCYRERVLIL